MYEDPMIPDASKRWVRDRHKIARRYFFGWFWLDFISCAVSAFDFVGLDKSVALDKSVLSVLRALRLIKLLRLMRLARLFRRWEKRLVFNYGTMALYKCVVYVLMTCHWCSCAWTLQTLFVSDLMATWRGVNGYCWHASDAVGFSSLAPPDPLADEDGIICSSPGETWMAGFYLMMMTITLIIKMMMINTGLAKLG